MLFPFLEPLFSGPTGFGCTRERLFFKAHLPKTCFAGPYSRSRKNKPANRKKTQDENPKQHQGAGVRLDRQLD